MFLTVLLLVPAGHSVITLTATPNSSLQMKPLSLCCTLCAWVLLGNDTVTIRRDELGVAVKVATLRTLTIEF